MDQISGLKYALVLVLVTSIILISWVTYLQRSFEQKVNRFHDTMGGVQTEAQAKEVIRQFMVDIDKDPVARSAAADNYPCQWLCGQEGDNTRTVPAR